ncbi:YcaO-like family protein [Bradyrhizobium sp. UFLA05-153]
MVEPHLEGDLTVAPEFDLGADRILTYQSGLRCRPVAEMRRIAERYFAPLGIDFERIDVNEPVGIPIFWGWHRRDWLFQRPQQEWNFGGKGLDEDQAMVSLMMESLERRQASRLEHPVLVEADARELGALVVPAETLALATLAGVREWGWARSLMDGCARLVPANALLTPYDPFCGRKLFQAEFNGLASGATAAEAILHGLFELIERDVVMRFQAQRWPVRRLHASDLENGNARAALERLTRHGVAWRLYHLGRAQGVHVFAGLSFDLSLTPVSVPPLASGAHADAGIAATRCVTEIVQARANTLFLRETEPAAADAKRNARLAERYLRFLGVAEMPPVATPAAPLDIAQLLLDTLAALQRVGGHVYAARLGKAPEGLEVIKLVAAGLQPVSGAVTTIAKVDKGLLSDRRTARLWRPLEYDDC